MNLIATTIADAYIIEPEFIRDSRGFFARLFCEDQFNTDGMITSFKQWSISFNDKKGTVRGLHLQFAPHPQTKMIRCTMGKILDVIVDVRPDSPSFKKVFSTELSAENRHTLYIPAGLVHGFQTLEDNCEVLYFMSDNWAPQCESGIKYNDKELAIEWPLTTSVVSDRDIALPSLKDFLEIQKNRLDLI